MFVLELLDLALFIHISKVQDRLLKTRDLVVHLMFGVELRKVVTARSPCVAAMVWGGSCPRSVATLPHTASTVAVRVPSFD